MRIYKGHRIFPLLILCATVLAILYLKGRPTTANEFEENWQSQNKIGELVDHETLYVLAAHYDNRSGNLAGPVVRVLQMRNWATHKTLMCIFSDIDKKVLGEVKSIPTLITAKEHIYGNIYDNEILTCHVGENNKHHPYYVTLSDDSVTVTLKVNYPIPSDKKKNIVNCVSLTFGNTDPIRLIEWLEMQRILKMGHVQIHHYEMPKPMEKVLRSYTKAAGDGFVSLVPVTPIFPNSTVSHRLLFKLTINNCIYKNMLQYDYVAVFDFDEIIFPKRHSDYESMLRYINNHSKRGKPNLYRFRNVWHLTDFSKSSNSLPNSIMMTQTKHLEPTQVGYHAKSIIDSQDCYIMHSHDCVKAFTGVKVEVDLSVGTNNHYRECPRVYFSAETCDKMTEGKIYDDPSIHRFKSILGAAIKMKMESLNL